MNFEMVDKLLCQEFNISRKELHKQGITYYNYFFENRFADTKRKNVAVEVRELQNGDVAGYIYVDIVPEYNKHPDKTKMGHLKISKFSLNGLRDILRKVVINYR